MTWKNISLGELISQRKEFIEIKPDETYLRCRVQTSARGVVLRDRVEGSTIKTKKQQVCRAGEFLVAEIDAKMGGYGVVPSELEGAIVSSHYFLYHVDETRLLRSFLDWYSKTPLFFEQVKARGSTNYAAIRPDAVLGYSIPLPSLDEQYSIVRRLDEVQAKLGEREGELAAVEHEANAMLFNAFQEIIDGVEYLPLSEVAPLHRRPVNIEPDVEYPELGARSFGRGLFHKPSLLGAKITWQQLFWIHRGDLVFSNIKAWEGAFGVASDNDHLRVGSHRYLTCVPKADVVSSQFLWYYLQSREGLEKVGAASPGTADRNRTLGQKALMAIQVPVPNLKVQQRFASLHALVEQVRAIRASTAKDAEALIPAMLREIFERQANKLEAAPVTSEANIIRLAAKQETEIDTPFKEAVLVGAIVKAFHEDNGQPIGNFRLQKAVYFARRQMGERALDKEYLRKAAGPYNPAMRYSGGIKIATDKNWIKRATGKYGEGNALCDSATEMDAWIERYQFAPAAAWVRDRFKYKSNDLWEALATIDYAMLALDHEGIRPTSAAIFAYIEADDEWRPKIEKLRLTEASIQNIVVELETLFANFGGSD